MCVCVYVCVCVCEPCSVKIDHNASAKRIDTGQPAQSAQADLDQNASLLVNFLRVK